MKGRRKEGYLTLYAALSLAVLLSLFMAILEGARLNTAQMEAYLIADIGTDSALAEYHREMLDRYGMFWIDTSYGTRNPSRELLESHILGYLEKNCDMNDVILGGIFYRDFLALCAANVQIEKISLATDDSGKVLRKRAVEVVKDDVGISLLEQLADWIKTVEDNDLESSVLEEEMDATEREIDSYNGIEVEVGENDWITVDVEQPTEAINVQKRNGILNLVVKDPAQISQRGVDLSGLISSRKNTGINEGNWGDENDENVLQRFLWQEYILRYCSNYTGVNDDNLLKYQVEYIIAGKNNDVENLRKVVNRIMIIREAANLMYLLSDAGKCSTAESVAAALSTALFIPEAEPAFKTAILLAWVYAESVYDVRTLLTGDRVPLLKSSDTWHYGIECVFDGVESFFEGWIGTEDKKTDDGDTGKGLCYKDYLRIFLFMSNLETQTFRVMDVMEMDIRQTKGNEYFRMDGCVDNFSARICIKSGFGYTFTVNTTGGY